MDISIGARSQATGRFNFVRDPQTRDVAFDNTEAHAVMSSAFEDLGFYWADETHGSELYKLENLSSKTPSMAEAMVGASLDSLERQARITNVAIDAEPIGRTNALEIDLRWRGVTGDNQQKGQI